MNQLLCVALFVITANTGLCALTKLYLGNHRIGTSASFSEVGLCLTSQPILRYYESANLFGEDFFSVTGKIVPGFDYATTDWIPIDSNNYASFAFHFIEKAAIDNLYKVFDIYQWSSTDSFWAPVSRWYNYTANHGFLKYLSAGAEFLQYPIVEDNDNIPLNPPLIVLPGDVAYTIPEPSSNSLLKVALSSFFCLSLFSRRRR
jgi:hypothetical protein